MTDENTDGSPLADQPKGLCSAPRELLLRLADRLEQGGTMWALIADLSANSPRRELADGQAETAADFFIRAAALRAQADRI